MSNASIRYNYPFANADKTESVKVAGSFNLQKAIDKTHGVVLEVAGPTPDGFLFLDNVTFPRRITISNRYQNGTALSKDKEMVKLCRPFVETLFDVRKDNVVDGSVGVCLASCLPLADFDHTKPMDSKKNSQLFDKLRKEDATLSEDHLMTPKYGLRNQLIYKATRFLEPHGLLMLNGTREEEIKYALKLGFALRATTLPKVDKGSGYTMYASIVLQKK